MIAYNIDINCDQSRKSYDFLLEWPVSLFYNSDEEEEDEEESLLENQYYNSKATKEESLKEALEGFAKVITLQSEKGEWGFKALKQMLKINFKLGTAVPIHWNYRTFFIFYVLNFSSWLDILVYLYGAVNKAVFIF